MLFSPAKVRTLMLATVLTSLAAIAAPQAHASQSKPSLGIAVRAGTLGGGLEFDVGLDRAFGMRIGYSAFNFNHSLSTSEVNYRGSIHLSNVTALFDWHPFRGGFHLTAGAVGENTHLDVTAQPYSGVYTLNGNTYSTSQLGHLYGQAKFANSTAPYIGIGWGNPVGMNSRLHLLLDIGAIYTGYPRVTLNAVCGTADPAGSPVCDAIQSDAAVEQQNLSAKLHKTQWYPVINLGLSVRF